MVALPLWQFLEVRATFARRIDYVCGRDTFMVWDVILCCVMDLTGP